MSRVGVDTVFWLAQLNPRDQWRSQARAAERRLEAGVVLVTTGATIAELLDACAERGAAMRNRAGWFVRQLLIRPEVEIVWQDQATFVAALGLYQQRPDKGYSLTDCSLMVTLRERGIRDVLTADHHFTQEGFQALLR